MAKMLIVDDLPDCQFCGKKGVNPFTKTCLTCKLKIVKKELAEYNKSLVPTGNAH